jgi:hypothetical protein
MRVVCVIVSGLLYTTLAVVGFVPSVVKKIVAFGVVVLIVTLTEFWNDPACGVNVGAAACCVTTSGPASGSPPPDVPDVPPEVPPEVPPDVPPLVPPEVPPDVPPLLVVLELLLVSSSPPHATPLAAKAAIAAARAMPRKLSLNLMRIIVLPSPRKFAKGSAAPSGQAAHCLRLFGCVNGEM